jgi:hypothetical protein
MTMLPMPTPTRPHQKAGKPLARRDSLPWSWVGEKNPTTWLPPSPFPSHQIQSLSLLQKVTHTAQFVGTTPTVLYTLAFLFDYLLCVVGVFFSSSSPDWTTCIAWTFCWIAISLTFKIQINDLSPQLGKQQRTTN